MVDYSREQALLRLAHRLIAVCGGAFLLVWFGLVVYLAVFDRAPPIMYEDFVTMDMSGRETKHFRAGDTMLLARRFCSNGAAVIIDRRFVTLDGHDSYAVPSAPALLPNGCVRST